MSGMKAFAIACGAAVAASVLVAPAMGQEQTSALKGHNTRAPVDVSADRIEVQDRADRAVFSGKVVARQGDLTLNAARVTVAYSSQGGVQIDRIDAAGGVTVHSPTETAVGQFATYDLRNRLITMIGNVTLTRGESHVTGHRLVLNMDSGRAVMDGGGTGPAGTTSAGGRVSGHFTVPQRND